MIINEEKLYEDILDILSDISFNILEEGAKPYSFTVETFKSMPIAAIAKITSKKDFSYVGTKVIEKDKVYTAVKISENKFTFTPALAGQSSGSYSDIEELIKTLRVQPTDVSVVVTTKEEQVKPKDIKTKISKNTVIPPEKQKEITKKLASKHIPHADQDFLEKISDFFKNNVLIKTINDIIDWFKRLLSNIFGGSDSGAAAVGIPDGSGTKAILFGDSQIAAGIGRALQKKLEEKNYEVIKLFVSGSSIARWTRSQELQNAIKTHKPSLVVASLGGNGGASGAKSLITKIKEWASKKIGGLFEQTEAGPKILFFGPPPAVQPTVKWGWDRKI